MAVTWKKLAYETDVIAKALLTTTGDVIYASGASTPARLGIGGAAQLLGVDAGIPAWKDVPPPPAHKVSHQDGGNDEINVAGLSGLLADDQHVLDAEVTAVIEATPLDNLAPADGAIDCGDQQLTDMALQNSAADPATPVVGKIYFKTGDLSAYICTVSA